LTTLQNQLGNHYIIIAEEYGKSKEIFNVFLAFKHFYWLKSICSSGKVGSICPDTGRTSISTTTSATEKAKRPEFPLAGWMAFPVLPASRRFQ
jgi:hypothetical protein